MSLVASWCFYCVISSTNRSTTYTIVPSPKVLHYRNRTNDLYYCSTAPPSCVFVILGRELDCLWLLKSIDFCALGCTIDRNSEMTEIDLGLGLEGAHVVVTGAAGFIGSVTVEAFLQAGAKVTALDINGEKLRELKKYRKTPDIQKTLYTDIVDITSESALENAFEVARQRFGVVQCCIALASLDLSVLPHHESIVDMPVEQWRRTHQVNVEGTFLTARTWLRQIKAYAKPDLQNVSLIIVGSESGWFGERSNPDYASGKSAVQVGLVQSLRGDVARIHPGAR